MKTTFAMKRLGLVALIAVAWVGCASAEVQVGDRYADVITYLGEPERLIRTENTAWLGYDRGTVKLSDDRVVEVSLVSREEARLRREREQAEYEQWRRELAEYNAQRLAHGWALRDMRIRDPALMAAPASLQVTFWREFQRHYPEIPVQDAYALALARHENEQEQMHRARDMERRIQELERQLRNAENRASQVRVHHVVYPSVIFVPAPPACTSKPAVARNTVPGLRSTSSVYPSMSRNSGAIFAVNHLRH